LIFFGERLGALVLESAKPQAFVPDDLPSLEAVADICAGAIYNARHFERTQQLAYLDGLTGIFNRRSSRCVSRKRWKRANRYNSQVSVVMLDIDHFKKLNDEFGHLLGDEVLRQVSTIFSQNVRKGDVLCRYGGEEFSLLLPQTSGQNAFEVAEKTAPCDREFPVHWCPAPGERQRGGRGLSRFRQDARRIGGCRGRSPVSGQAGWTE